VSLLQVDELQVRYGRGRTSLLALDRVSLQVEPGASLGIVGESGSGKSTLARAIVQLIRSSSGRIVLDGKDVTNARGGIVRHVRDRVQMVFQDPFSTLNPRRTIGATLEEAVGIRRRRDHARPEQNGEVDELLQLVTLDPGVLFSYPHQLSGGQLQRVAIARALAAKPRLLILDEVTSALDVSVQAAILNLLRHLRQTLGLAYICISHDLSVIGYLCETAIVMYLGQAIESAACAELFSSPRHPYSRMLLESIPNIRGDVVRTIIRSDVPDPRHPPSGCRFHPRCPIGPMSHPERTICVETDPTRSSANGKAGPVACHFPLSTPAARAS
jgi:peptide/nickel transport system ATP-binding protein